MRGKDKLRYLPFALALVVAALVVLVLLSGDPFAEKAAAPTQGPRVVRRTEALLAGIPQQGAVLGDPKAPVTLQFFGDLQSVNSRRVMLGSLSTVISRWVRSGELRIVFRSTNSDTPKRAEFREQQIAALAAGRQDRMWNYVVLFYRKQGPKFTRYADERFLEEIAGLAGVSPGRWARDRESPGWAGKIKADEALAEATYMETTPSFLIGPTGGKFEPLVHFLYDQAGVFDSAIYELLRA